MFNNYYGQIGKDFSQVVNTNPPPEYYIRQRKRAKTKKIKMLTAITVSTLLTGSIGYALGGKFGHSKAGGLIGAYIPFFFIGNVAQSDISLTRGFVQTASLLSKK